MDGIGDEDRNHDLHVVAATSDGGLFHAVRSASGWTSFGNVEGQSGDAGTVTDVGTTGRENGELHVLVTDTAGHVRHTVRRASGWTDWGDVEGQSGPLPANPLEVSMSRRSRTPGRRAFSESSRVSP